MRLHHWLFSAAALCAVIAFDPTVLSASLPVDDLLPAPQPHVSGLKVLSATDRELYLDAFDLQHSKRFDESDTAVSHVSNPILKGTLLAQRYLGADYKPTYDELATWLAHYSDLPQAGDIYRLAIARSTTSPSLPEEPATTHSLKGFGNGQEKSTLHNDEGGWTAGLAAYRKGEMASAATHFRTLSDHSEDMPSGDRAAAAFWAYRALLAAGNTPDALRYVARAAAEPPGFYSTLARHITGLQPHPTESVATQLERVTPLLDKDPIRRVIALKEVAQDALAEMEIRAMYPTSDDAERKRLITLASLIDLPAAQMRMALDYTRITHEASDTSYPMPHWAPLSGYHIEPALLFAIMRQESGFNPDAHNRASGATGVMQLIPSTAQAMAQVLRVRAHNHTPSVSMALGQGYLERLMETPSIGNNLVLLVAAYNAGPGNVDNWKRSLHYAEDPLLFIESVPFAETRDYLRHVIGNYWIYSDLLGVEDKPSVAALAQGSWPVYEGSGEQVTSMLSHLGDN